MDEKSQAYISGNGYDNLIKKAERNEENCCSAFLMKNSAF